MESRGEGAKPVAQTLFGLQIARGLAAVLVVFAHATLALEARGLMERNEYGAIGVDIFFVISGFVIFLTGRKLTWREFFVRRLVRVIPLYWFFLTIKVALILASGNDPTGSINNPIFVAGSYLFVPVYRESMKDIYPIIVSGWTLNYEMYFYVVAAVALAVMPRRLFASAVSFYMVLAVSVGLVALSLVSAMDVPPLVLLRPICLEFVAGIWLARWWTGGRHFPVWVPACLLVLAVGMMAAVPPAINHGPWRVLLWGTPALAFVAALVFLEPFVPFRRWTWALIVGDASYSIYLSHTAVLPIFDHAIRRLPSSPALQMAAFIVCSVIVGVLVHFIIEKPLLRRVSHLVGLHVRQPAMESAHKGR